MNKEELKKKFKTQFVIIWKNKYFGCDFENRTIKEIDFKEAYGCSFFDWTNNISIADDYFKQMYEKARGKDGCGLTEFFNKRNDLRDFQLELIKGYEEEIKKVGGL